MNALSEALKSVRMTGAIFYRAECASLWGFAVPAVSNLTGLERRSYCWRGRPSGTSLAAIRTPA
jgi:hypothetical protein